MMSRCWSDSVVWWIAPCLLLVAGCENSTDGRADASSQTEDAASTEVVKTGSVSVTQTRVASGDDYVVTTSYSAGFTRRTANSGGSDESCETYSANGCSITKCDESGDDSSGADAGGSSDNSGTDAGDSGSAAQPPTAGTITLEGKESLSFSPTEEGFYIPPSVSSPPRKEIWDGEQSVTVSASGADVPAFSTELRPLAKVPLTAPQAPSGDSEKLNVPTTEPLDVSWETDNISREGQFQVVLSASKDTQMEQIVCRWDASSGSNQVPPEMLGRLPAPASGSMEFQVRVRKTIEAGDYDVTITAAEETLGQRFLQVSYAK